MSSYLLPNNLWKNYARFISCTCFSRLMINLPHHKASLWTWMDCSLSQGRWNCLFTFREGTSQTITVPSALQEYTCAWLGEHIKITFLYSVISILNGSCQIYRKYYKQYCRLLVRLLFFLSFFLSIYNKQNVL